MPMKTEHPNDGCNSPRAASTNKVPTIGQYKKDTIASANKIKSNNSSSICLAIYFICPLGNIISNAPKNEAAKTTNKTKKIILNQTLVDKAFNASAPKIQVTKTQKNINNNNETHTQSHC
jgi:hypothetical protein